MWCSEYICLISGMEDQFAGVWHWDQPSHTACLVILVIKAWNGFITVLIGGIVLR